MAGAVGNSRQVELETLYATHFGKVVGWFRHSGLNEALARDLAQDSFVSALRALPNFKGDSQLSTWVWAIARNVLLAHWRAAPQPTGLQALDGDKQPLDPDSLTDGADAHQSECADCVRRGFAAFSAQHPERAQVIYLAVVEGWTREELAAHLGRTLHAATEYLSQCKARLRPFLQDCHDD